MINGPLDAKIMSVQMVSVNRESSIAMFDYQSAWPVDDKPLIVE